MVTNWQKFDNIFIHPKHHDTGLMRGKARVLTFVHLMVLAFSIATTILDFTFLPQKGNQWIIGLSLSFLCIYVFKKWGNFNISGNLIALGCALATSGGLFKVGYLNSDDYHWLMICPMFASLFGNGRSTVFWMLAFAATGFVLYSQQILMSPNNTSLYTPLHYFISYNLLALVFTLTIYLYKKGEDKIFNIQQKQNDFLTAQRQELHQKTTELHKMQEQLTRSNNELASFAYSAGHDLKEPLRMISAYTSLLKRKLQPHLTGDTEEFMGYVTRGSVQMSNLLDDLLEFSKIGRGKDKFAMIDLDDVLYYVKNNLKLVIEETGAVIIQPEELPKVYARYSEMVQLFQNLISNALKFRKKDIEPQIEINVTVKENVFKISVKDNGIGIADEFHNKVFMPFERFHARNAYEGSGLGMAICHKIVENAGGEIWLESKETVGTTFFFTLPKQVPNETLESVESDNLILTI
jgi:signal transduction histidine kinase